MLVLIGSCSVFVNHKHLCGIISDVGTDFSRAIHFTEQPHEKSVIFLIVAASSYAFNFECAKGKKDYANALYFFVSYCICNTLAQFQFRLPVLLG